LPYSAGPTAEPTEGGRMLKLVVRYARYTATALTAAVFNGSVN
jgi:hypothetical protein